MEKLKLLEKIYVKDVNQLSYHYMKLIDHIEYAIKNCIDQKIYANEINHFVQCLVDNDIINGLFDYSIIPDKQIVKFLEYQYYRLCDWQIFKDVVESVEDICSVLRTKYIMDIKDAKRKEIFDKMREEISNS